MDNNSKMVSFKEFVKNNPFLIGYIKNGKKSWQDFYEMYDLYGEDENIWKDYLKKEEVKEEVKTTTTSFGISEVVNWLKNVDLDGLQEGIGNVQRVLGVVQDFTKKENKEVSTYKPRPLYKHFED